MGDRGRPGRMVSVSVCNENLGETQAAERAVERLDVPRIAGAGIDKRGDPPSKQPGPVPLTRYQTRVERMNRDWVQKKTFSLP